MTEKQRIRIAEDESEQIYETLDEAVFQALSELDPGGRLDVHTAECESKDGIENCTCIPKTYYKGAEA